MSEEHSSIDSEKIESRAFISLLLIKLTGVFAIIIFAIGFSGFRFPYDFLWMLVIISGGIALAGASMIIGGLFGLLFAIPRFPAEDKKYNISSKDNHTDNNISDNVSYFSLNNNLVKVSDWLATIIVGLGLTQLNTIPSRLSVLKLDLTPLMGGTQAGGIFGVCIVLFYLITGFIAFYFWCSLYLPRLFEKSRLAVILQNQRYNASKEYLKPDELIQNQNFVKGMLNTSNLTVATDEQKRKFHEFVDILSKTKNEKDYNFEDWYYKGISEYLKNNFAESVKFINNAVNKDPLNAEAYIYI